MKILMVAPEPFFQPRGTPFSVLARIQALTDLGHQVDLVTYPLGQDVEIPGLRIYRIPRLPFLRSIPIGPSWVKFPLDLFILLASLWRMLRLKYDIIHTHEEAGGIGALFRILLGRRHVYDMHSSLLEQLRNYGFTRSRPLLAMMRWFERWVISHSDVVIAVCPELVSHVAGFAPEKRVILIENQPVAADRIATPEEGEKLRQELGLEGKFVALYTGTFEMNQGLDLLIHGIPNVLKGCREVVFVLVGGEQAQVAFYRSMAEDVGVGEHVRFTGKRPPEEMPIYLALADVLLSPRKTGTNTPLKIYSYLWAGKAIVATDLETHRQILDESIAVMAEPTPDGFARAIVDLLKDKEKRSSLGKRAALVAAERYSYRSYLSRVEDAYA